ncbi:MAG: pyrroloquinoline-quinone synthase PqqC [Acidobacteria bacterium]|nr:pyrroloquinoline-quinone synthase PqqC [Acidobacteriota bacterium]
MQAILKISGETAAPLSAEELERQLRAIGAERYHDKHPYHVLMHEGKLTHTQMQAWVLNRFYYQTRIPMKDAAILSNAPDQEFRRVWIQRILDHDGREPGTGGIMRWIKLGEAVGLSALTLASFHHVLPSVRFAVDAYVNFARTRPLLEAVASSLTELFSSDIISRRVAALHAHYPWIDPQGLVYFQARLVEGPRDADFALDFVLTQARTREQQERALAALRFKCDVLWSMLDALYVAYIEPGWRRDEKFTAMEAAPEGIRYG